MMAEFKNRSEDLIAEVAEQAIKALISMDAQRLEDLADCCEALNGSREADTQGGFLRCDYSSLPHGMKVLERMLFETRANLTVFTRLHQMRIKSISGISRPSDGGVYGDN